MTGAAIGLIRLMAALVAIALAAMPVAASATDTAVLIGVGQLANMPESNLDGIGLDVDMMKGVADRLGYSAQIELRDGQGTRQAILALLERVLVTQASPDDRVLIYFSGHGTRIPVDDGAGHVETHSAIVAADVKPTTTRDGTDSLAGVVIGKEFADLFSRAKVKSVILVVDACHSGSIDKAVHLGVRVLGTTRATRKLLVWPGMPGARPAAFAKAVGIGLRKDGAATGVRYVSIAAAGDEESAIATPSGSLFTVAITQAIAGTSAAGAITPRQTVNLASDYIAREAAKVSSEVFHPEVHGADALIDAPMQLTDTRAGGGPNWREVARITGGLPALKLTGLQPQYKDGQEVRMAVDVPADGYLNVMAVGPDDTVTVLYPNQNARDNHVKAGSMALPGDIPQVGGQAIYYPVTAPYGKTVIAAIVTRDPLNLVSDAVDANSGHALFTPTLAALNALMAKGDATRSIALGVRNAANISAWSAQAVVQTCGAGGC